MKIHSSPASKLNLAHNRGGTWPTPGQELLLRAALLHAPDAPEAWRQWQKVERLDALDSASWKLLPLAYLNLSRLGVQDPILDEARALHRYHWARNQKLFNRVGAFLDELHHLNVPTLVLKGVALSQLYYRDAGARPMEDLDLLVPAESFWFVADYLFKKGWRQGEGGCHFAYYDMTIHHAYGFVRDDGFSVDLHAHVLQADCMKNADEAFWSQAQSWPWQNKSTLTLCPEDHLLHAISHGVRWNPVPPCRWMADVWWILQRTRAEFNWERFIGQARFHRVHLSVGRGLERMQAIVPLELPLNLLGSLAAMPAPLKVRIDFAWDLNPKPMTLTEILGIVWGELEKDQIDSSWSAKLSNLRSYLFEEWKIRSTVLIPLAAGKMLVRYFMERIKILALSHPRLEGTVARLQAMLLIWRKNMGSLPKRPA